MISGWYLVYPAPNGTAHLFGFDQKSWWQQNQVPLMALVIRPAMHVVTVTA